MYAYGQFPMAARYYTSRETSAQRFVFLSYLALNQLLTVRISREIELIEPETAWLRTFSLRCRIPYHGTSPCASIKLPVGPSSGSVASLKEATVPSCTVCVPL